MNHLIMPKQTGSISRLRLSLEILADFLKISSDPMPNSEFKKELQTRNPSDFTAGCDGPMMVKQSEIARYFGLVHYDYGKRTQQITDRGLSFLEHLLVKNQAELFKTLGNSILHDAFGRNNTAMKNSDSDIDPPKLFVRSIRQLEGITKSELACLIYLTNDCNLRDDDAMNEILRQRDKKTSIAITAQNVNKYNDTKFPKFLVEINFCTIDSNERYQLNLDVVKTFGAAFSSLDIYNREPKFIKNLDTEDDSASDILEADQSANYKKQVTRSMEYDKKSEAFKKQNTRSPKLKNQSLNGRKYSTNPRIAKTALSESGYQCELDSTHITFTNKEELPFMEPHHLIPMSAQPDFNFNLDCIENIVSLCPNCHSAVHYGNDETREALFYTLFKERKKALKALGNEMKKKEIFEKYYT
ncbi:MAG: HNH endonuclease [Eubacteriales bacterium]